MTQGRLRLHHRIAIPFALLALLATSVAALVAVSATSVMASATRRLVATVLVGPAFSLAVMIVIGQVITRRVTAPIDEALVRSEKLALAGVMAARVAHDIRNPLSSIKMQTQ